jgi:hypothetical protein
VGVGLAIVLQAAILSIDHLIALGSTFLWVTSAINAIFSLWLFTWTFARSWHVERPGGADRRNVCWQLDGANGGWPARFGSGLCS